MEEDGEERFSWILPNNSVLIYRGDPRYNTTPPFTIWDLNTEPEPYNYDLEDEFTELDFDDFQDMNTLELIFENVQI